MRVAAGARGSSQSESPDRGALAAGSYWGAAPVRRGTRMRSTAEPAGPALAESALLRHSPSKTPPARGGPSPLRGYAPPPEFDMTFSILTPFRPALALGLALALPAVGLAQVNDSGDAEKQALRAQLAELKAAVVNARGDVLKPIRVNGVEVSVDRFRRQAIYLVGAKQLQAKIAELLLEEQKSEQIQGGREAKEFEIPEEELIAGLKTAVEEFRRQNPDVDFWQAVRAQFGFEREQFLAQQRQTKLFDRVFFPGPAANWPLVTREAIISSSGGDGKQFWDNLVKASTHPETGEPRDLPPFWMQLCRGWVTKQLQRWSDVRYASDGLPAEICLAVNDRTWATADAYREIQTGLYVQELERAVGEVTINEALHQALAKAGFLLTEEEFRAEFEAYRKQYDDTPFNTEVIATAFKGYPSLEAFRQRWRLIRSFERMIEADMNDTEKLQAHANTFAAFFGDGQVNVDLIQFMGRDLKTGAWVPGGLDAAGKRADAVMKLIEEGADFDEMHQTHGEFYATDKEKGRLGSKSLNQIRQAVRESEFNDLLTGYSLAAHLYYDAKPGTVVGPLRGPDAWFVARVNSRTPSAKTVNLTEERTRELVRQDYVNWRFLEWANQVVASTEFQ